MRLEEELEGVENVLTDIKGEEEEAAILVEGKKDVEALEEMGINRDIIKVKRGERIYRIIEKLRGRYEKLIILTDWDKTGGRLSQRIKMACKSNVIDFDLKYRERLIKFLKKEVKDVESIPSFLKRARRILEDPYSSRENR